MISTVRADSFEDYLKKTGNGNVIDMNQYNDEVRSNSGGGAIYGDVSSSAIRAASEGNVFDAADKFGSKQSSNKETQGSGAASSSNPISSFISNIASSIINNNQNAGSADNSANLAAGNTGHSYPDPGSAPVLSSALTRLSGNEQPKFDAQDLYNQYLQNQKNQEQIDEQGDTPSGEGMVSANNEFGAQRHEVDGHGETSDFNSNAGGAEGRGESQNNGNVNNQSGTSSNSESNNDSSNENNSKNIKKQEEHRQEVKNDEERNRSGRREEARG